MDKPDIRQLNTGIKGLEFKEGEQRRMSGDNAGNCSPFLEFNSDSPLVTKEMQLDFLARLLVAAYMEQRVNERNKKKEGSDLLPRFNKRTGG